MGLLIFIFEGQANGFPGNLIASKTYAFYFPGRSRVTDDIAGSFLDTVLKWALFPFPYPHASPSR